MEELKEKAFGSMDLNFTILLKFKAKHNHEMVRHVARDINSKSNLLLEIGLITFDEWEFINNATVFVQCGIEIN